MPPLVTTTTSAEPAAVGGEPKKEEFFLFFDGCNRHLQTGTDAPKYNPHYSACHRGRADTCGIRKTEAAKPT